MQKEALAFKRKIRLNAQLDAKLRTDQLYKIMPQLATIDEEIAANSKRAVLLALDGKTSEVIECKNHNQKLNQEKLKILTELDIDQNYLLPQYDCKKCNDEGYCYDKICDCVNEIVTKQNLRKLNKISYLSLNSTFKSFNLDYYPENERTRMKAVVEACADYANNFIGNENMMFMGATGLGKTHLSMAIANLLITKGYEVLYASTQELFNSIEKEKFSYNKTENDHLNTVLNCQLLILDDLGSEFSTTYIQSLVYTIINSRLNKSLATIISTNHSLEELQAKYTDRVLSRITGNYSMKQFVGNDIRAIIRLNSRVMTKKQEN